MTQPIDGPWIYRWYLGINETELTIVAVSGGGKWVLFLGTDVDMTREEAEERGTFIGNPIPPPSFERTKK